MNKTILTALTLCLGLCVSSWAQLSETDTKAFPIVPPGGKAWTAIKTFKYTGDYLYKSTNHRYPTVNTYVSGLSYSNYDYFFFSNVRGKRLNLYVTYDGTPATDAGSCAHTHLNYGAKGYYSLKYAGIPFSGWTWLGGGTQSGEWNAVTKTCKRSVVNSLAKSIPLFGWGIDFISIFGTSQNNFGSTKYIDNVVFVVAAPTHSVGDCKAEYNPASGMSFKACLDAAYVYAWTTPL